MSVSNKATHIYGLIDPRSLELRYVGKTVKSISCRLSDHLSKARSGGSTHRCNWIRKVVGSGFRPEIFEIECIPPGADWVEAESFWIEYYRSLGCRLTNLTLGGEGTTGYNHSPSTKSAVAALKRKLYADNPDRRAAVGALKRQSQPQENNVSGFRSVTPAGGRWRAGVKVNGDAFFLGLFPRTEQGRISAAVACDRLETLLLGPEGLAPRVPGEMKANILWCAEHRNLPLASVVKEIRLEAASAAPLHSRNKSGFRGVTLHAKAKKWQARTFIAGRAHSLGLFPYTDDGKIAAAKALDQFEATQVCGRSFVPRVIENYPQAPGA